MKCVKIIFDEAVLEKEMLLIFAALTTYLYSKSTIAIRLFSLHLLMTIIKYNNWKYV